MPDAQILFARTPFIQYSQILLTKSFRQYLETIMMPKVVRMEIQKTPFQKRYELQVGSQEIDVDFKGCERQFDWLEISLVYDKRDKHITIYDSCNADCAARMINNIELFNISDVHSATNTMKFDITNDTQKHLLWKQYIAWHYDGYTNASISYYINNPVFQELLPENTYISNTSDEIIYIDLKDSLGYTNEMEKPSGNDFEIKVNNRNKNSFNEKNEA